MIALEQMNWSKKKCARVAEVLIDQAMSSEDSCFEDIGNGNTKAVAYDRKKLPWESERFAKAKQELDAKYQCNLAQRSKDRLIPRKNSEHDSTRPAPGDFPDWATI